MTRARSCWLRAHRVDIRQQQPQQINFSRNFPSSVCSFTNLGCDILSPINCDISRKGEPVETNCAWSVNQFEPWKWACVLPATGTWLALVDDSALGTGSLLSWTALPWNNWNSIFQVLFSSPSRSVINSVPKILNAICSQHFSAMFMAIYPVYRDAAEAVPPKSKGGSLIDFTLLCWKSHKSSTS